MALNDWRYKPATDIDLSPSQRWKSVRRENGLFEEMTQGLWWALVKAYLKCVHSLTVYGSKQIPRVPPFVFVANHESHLDALVLTSIVPHEVRRRVLPVAAGDTFFVSPLVAAFAAACLNALPLWRRNTGYHAMLELRHRLISEPCSYILFPEGRRSRNGLMMPFKPGVGMLVAGTDVNVVPCFLEGTFEALGPQSRWPRPHPIHVRIGEPLRFQQTPNDREGWTHIARELENRIKHLTVLE